MTAKVKTFLFRLTVLALSAAAAFGFRCPAPGCPCCKLVGK
jgi:hypothetical protein